MPAFCLPQDYHCNPDDFVLEPTNLLHLQWHKLKEVTPPSSRWHLLEIDEPSSEDNPGFTYISRKRG